VPDPKTVVIVGGGLAGASAAAALREEGFDGRVVVIAAEPQLPYERPPLSKSYLAGNSTLEDARAHPDGFYAEHDIEVLTGTEAVGLDVAARRVALAGGDELGYDRLLLATGAVPRRPPIEGADGEHVHLLRTVADSDALHAAAGGGGRLAIVGAGWIGCEVAASARGLGAEVTLIEQAAAPLERVMGRRLGDFFADLHRGHGVDLRLGAGVAAIEDGGRGVRLSDGERIGCDAVLLAVGVAPATALAEAAGLDLDNGVVTSELLETSAAGVYAAGDVASALHPVYGRHVRVEHWDNAKAQGAAAGRSMLGTGEPYAKLPYFFTDQYDLGMEYVGLHGPEDELVLRGSLEEQRFQAFWTAADGTVTAGMHVNDWDAIGPIREIVGRREAIDAT
jgi:3-phenylpropionate/trans-cinnamate dioxygenase ferredoxin reductase component